MGENIANLHARGHGLTENYYGEDVLRCKKNNRVLKPTTIYLGASKNMHGKTMKNSVCCEECKETIAFDQPWKFWELR